jgi:hypothetical protein
MKKANTSDITQFTLLFTSTSTSCMCSASSLSPLPQLTVQSRSLDHLLVYHRSRLNRGVQLFGTNRVEGVLLFFCLLFTYLTMVAQFRPNVRASGYVSCTSLISSLVRLHLYAPAARFLPT